MTWIWILAGLVGLLLVLIVAAVAIMYRNPRKAHQRTPEKFNVPFQEVRFPTKNNRNLYGWWIPAKDKRPAQTLVLVHGWGRNVERMLPYIRQLHASGYNLLAFDSRNHGSSDPDRYSSMLKFAEDIVSAVDFVQKQSEADPERIGLLGLSIGGAASIYAAAHDPRIRSVVTVGAFAHPGEVMRYEFRQHHIPFFPLVWLLFKYVEFRIGAKLDAIAPVKNIQQTNAHIFLIHGQKDVIVPPEQARQLESAGNPEKVHLWLIPEKGHSDCHFHPEFWGKVESFLEQTLHSNS